MTRLLRGGQLRFLDRRQIYDIHMAALEILEKVGVKIESQMIFDIFKDAGARVNPDKKIAYIPQHLVGECIRKAPKKVYLCGRNQEYDLVLEGNRFCFGLGGSPKSRFLDIDTGLYRNPTLRDIDETTRLADALQGIHFVQNLGQPMDKQQRVQYLYVAKAMLENTEKHSLCTAASGRDAKTIIDMASRVENDLTKRPIVSIYTCPTSPLTLSVSQENIVETAREGVPTVVCTAPQAGATAPVTLAGAVAQNIAENLASLTLAEIVNPGVPIVIGATSTIMDPRTSMFSVGAPEFVIEQIMCVQVSHFYDLPYFGGGGLSDSKIPDGQAAAEAMMTLLTSALVGMNMIQDVGILAFDDVGSPEMAVICDEIIGYVERIIQSSEVNYETLALDVIRDVGPGGSFLSHKHTLRHVRDEVYLPRLFDRLPESLWFKKGAKDIRMVAREKAKKIMAEHHPERLPESTLSELNDILRKEELGNR